MPGKVLVIDPMLENRVLLKARLSRAFFSVSFLTAESDLAQLLSRDPPDVVVLSHDAARAADYRQIDIIRRTLPGHHLPIVLLHDAGDPTVWTACLEHRAEEAISHDAPPWLLPARLTHLLRMKEKLDAMLARQRIFHEHGFGEAAETAPAAPAAALGIDLSWSGLSAAAAAGVLDTVSDRLQGGAAARAGEAAEIAVISETPFGPEAARRRVVSLRRAWADRGRGADGGLILYHGATLSEATLRQLAELGADDIALSAIAPQEMAARLCHLGWRRQMKQTLDGAMTRHLRSAMQDALTGLFNRRYAEQYLDRLLDQAADPRSVTVMMLDLDSFKRINDRFGHGIGDTVLREAAERLRGALRTSDMIARIGGEEFLVVLRDTPADTAQRIAERLRRDIAARPFRVGRDLSIPVSVSIGVSRARGARQTALSPAALLEDADAALYSAKHGGRNRVIFRHLRAA